MITPDLKSFVLVGKQEKTTTLNSHYDFLNEWINDEEICLLQL